MRRHERNYNCQNQKTVRTGNQVVRKKIFKEHKFLMVAVTFVVATIILSCKDSLPATDSVNPTAFPSQIIENMSVQQTDGGIVVLRIEAPVMERFTEEKEPYDNFPKGINVKAFTKEGILETEIRANFAKHINAATEEIWEANGNVIVNNYVKGEKMVTDTLYWDRVNKKIFTKCWVKLTTPDMFMQGYGMESDDRAGNAIILRPFDSYAIVTRDSLEVPYIDTINFIGPLIPKKK